MKDGRASEPAERKEECARHEAEEKDGEKEKAEQERVGASERQRELEVGDQSGKGRLNQLA